MKTEYDVVIAGSGAGGGFCAMALAQRGLKVLVLERGKQYDYLKDYPMNYPDWELKVNPLSALYETFDHGTRATIDASDYNICSGKFIDEKLVQYQPSQRGIFQYQRVLGVGGSTLHYQGEAHRFPEHAFKPKTLFGWGEDWPLDYQTLAPYYYQAEKILGVAGDPNNPFKPARATFPTPAHALSTKSQLAKVGANELGWSLLPNSLALPSVSVDGRLPCQHSGGCVQGCIFGAKSSVDLTAIKIAEKTGNLTLLTKARLLEIETDSMAKVSGFVYKHEGKLKKATASKYVLALGAIETPRLLLSSQSGKHPNGIGNQHDNVGRYFMETIMASLDCCVDQQIQSYKGPPLDSRIWDFSMPKEPLKSGFALGVAGTLGGRLSPVSYAWDIPGFGLEHKQIMRDKFGKDIQLFGIAEHIPDRNNRITITNNKDADGVPLARVYSDYSAEDKKTLKVMIERIIQWSNACGIQEKRKLNSTYSSPAAAHVAGTCRMGLNSEISVTDQFGQVHEIDNLYISDASLLPTLGAGDSPSLTIQALALRIAENM